jgi:hypothetical protein
MICDRRCPNRRYATRRQRASGEHSGDKDRHARDGGGAVGEACDVEFAPGGDEERGDEDAEASGLGLLMEERVGHRLVVVGELDRGAGQECAEDRLEPERGCEKGEDDEQ